MNKNAIVWRKSVYDNDYKCSCGKILFEKGDLISDVLIDISNDAIICPKCMKVVAAIMNEKDAKKIAIRGVQA